MDDQQPDTIRERLDREHPWVAAPCGHSHRRGESLDPAFMDRFLASLPCLGRTFLVASPVDAEASLDHSDDQPAITVGAGALVRCDAWVGFVDGCSDIYYDAYRCQVLTGPQAGVCFNIDDAGTAQGPTRFRGSRPILGLPEAFVEKSPPLTPPASAPAT